MEEPEAIDPTVEPSDTGCAECLASDGWWFHLRRCARCGHVGCCDQSPSQHATRHAMAGKHPVIQTFEPDEDWFYDYRTDQYGEGPELAPPQHHPVDQPVRHGHRPRVRPIDELYVDGTIYVGGSPEAAWVRAR